MLYARRMMNGRQDAACAAGVPDHLPFFASGRKSTMRLYPVAAAIGCSVRIVAWVRQRSAGDIALMEPEAFGYRSRHN